MNESPQAVQPIAIKPAAQPFDAARAREDFPAFAQQVHGRPLVFLDSAASAQKPRAVIEAVCHSYEKEYANVHRGVYWLSQRATEAFVGELIDGIGMSPLRAHFRKAFARWLAGQHG